MGNRKLPESVYVVSTILPVRATHVTLHHSRGLAENYALLQKDSDPRIHEYRLVPLRKRRRSVKR